jgi:hypothetical protein
MPVFVKSSGQIAMHGDVTPVWGVTTVGAERGAVYYHSTVEAPGQIFPTSNMTLKTYYDTGPTQNPAPPPPPPGK